MPLYIWRFQSDPPTGDPDPVVTAFVGPERQKMDDNGHPTGRTFIEQSTADPLTMRLSELPAALAAGPVTRAAKPFPC